MAVPGIQSYNIASPLLDIEYFCDPTAPIVAVPLGGDASSREGTRDRVASIATSILRESPTPPPPSLPPVTRTALLTPRTAEVSLSSSNITPKPLADRNPTSTAAGGAGASSSVSLRRSIEKVNSALDMLIERRGDFFEQELNLLLQTYVADSSALPEAYKRAFQNLTSTEARFAYVVIEDEPTISAVERLIERLIANEEKNIYYHMYFRQRLERALGNSLFQFKGHFVVIHENEFKYPFAHADFTGVSSKIKTSIPLKDEGDKDDQGKLAFLAFLNRCPSSAKAEIDPLFEGELTRYEGFLHSKGAMSAEGKKALEDLMISIDCYQGRGSLLYERLMVRLQDALWSDLPVLDRGGSTNHKLKMLFEAIFPSYFPEDIPKEEELLQVFSQICFSLLFFGKEDLSGVDDILREKFLGHLVSIHMFPDDRSPGSMVDAFLKLVNDHPDYLLHVKRLKFNVDLPPPAAGEKLAVVSLLTQSNIKNILPRLETWELHPNMLPVSKENPYIIDTNYLLSIIQNIPTLKTIKIESYGELWGDHLPTSCLDCEAMISFSAALRIPVTIAETRDSLSSLGWKNITTITIGERAA